MNTISQGLTKQQAQQIVRTVKARKKVITGREILEGVFYEAESKQLTFTDGYFMVCWDLSRLLDDVLPKEDVAIHFTKINAWVANAGSKDILKWDELLAMGEPARVIGASRVVKEKMALPDNSTVLLNPVLLTYVVPFLPEKVKITAKSESVITIEATDVGTVRTYAVVMGMRG